MLVGRTLIGLTVRALTFIGLAKAGNQLGFGAAMMALIFTFTTPATLLCPLLLMQVMPLRQVPLPTLRTRITQVRSGQVRQLLGLNLETQVQLKSETTAALVIQTLQTSHSIAKGLMERHSTYGQTVTSALADGQQAHGDGTHI